MQQYRQPEAKASSVFCTETGQRCSSSCVGQLLLWLLHGISGAVFKMCPLGCVIGQTVERVMPMILWSRFGRVWFGQKKASCLSWMQAWQIMPPASSSVSSLLSRPLQGAQAADRLPPSLCVRLGPRTELRIAQGSIAYLLICLEGPDPRARKEAGALWTAQVQGFGRRRVSK